MSDDDRDLPGARIVEYRKAAKLTQRALSELCDPPMDFTAIGKIERNKGYSSSTLKRIAVALDCSVSDFFLPDELVAWKYLPDDVKQEFASLVKKFKKLSSE